MTQRTLNWREQVKFFVLTMNYRISQLSLIVTLHKSIHWISELTDRVCKFQHPLHQLFQWYSIQFRPKIKYLLVNLQLSYSLIKSWFLLVQEFDCTCCKNNKLIPIHKHVQKFKEDLEIFFRLVRAWWALNEIYVWLIFFLWAYHNSDNRFVKKKLFLFVT